MKNKGFKDSSDRQVMTWLAQIFDLDLDIGAAETVEDVLEVDDHYFPAGLEEAIYIRERFPVRQNIWHLTSRSKLAKVINDAFSEKEEGEDRIFLLLSDSSLAGADSLILVQVSRFEEDEKRSPVPAVWGWGTGKAPTMIQGSCYLKGRYVIATGLQLKSIQVHD